MEAVTREFTLERETPNKLRFAEEGDEAGHAVGKQYVSKSVFAEGEQPERIRVTIESV